MKIGIDFGTTKTMVSYYDTTEGLVKLIPLGRDMSKTDIPTTCHVSRSGKWTFGEDADDLAVIDPEGYARAFKLTLGSNDPVLMREVEGRSESWRAGDCATNFLGFIRERCEKRLGVIMQDDCSIDAATIAIPVCFSPARIAEIHQSAIDAGFKSVEFVSEPEAAACAFLRSHPDANFQQALVVDWGGGTIDISAVRRERDGRVKPIRGKSAGRDDIGGEEFDIAFLRHFSDKYEKVHGKLPIADNDVFRTLQLRRNARKDKEILSVKETVLSRMPGKGILRAWVRITRDEFNAKISTLVESACDLIESLKINNGGPIVLVGGTSKVPMVRTGLESRFPGVDILTWAESREAVAIGALKLEPWKPGNSHPYLDHLVSGKNRGSWLPVPGFRFLNDKAGDFRVKWLPNVPYSDENLHVLSTDIEGRWQPEPGYVWERTHNDKVRSSSIVHALWEPNFKHRAVQNVVSAEEEGQWTPMPGYEWRQVSKPEKGVKWVPGLEHPIWSNVVAADTAGIWRPEAGYIWDDDFDDAPRLEGELSDAIWESGIEHPNFPHVLTTDNEGIFKPEAGYVWVRPNGHIGRVRWRSGMSHPDHPHVHSMRTEGQWAADFGWEFINDDDGDLNVTKSWYNPF